MISMKSRRRKVTFIRRNTDEKFKTASGIPLRRAAANTKTYVLPQPQAMTSMHQSPFIGIPYQFTIPPPLNDELQTKTSAQQKCTIDECLQALNAVNDSDSNGFDFNEFGILHLKREAHIPFLQKSLGVLPAGFVAADASRPWMVYWALMGLSLLGEDVTVYCDRLVSSAR